MKEITLTKKTGFRNNTPNEPVIIFDSRGILFYTTEFFTKPVNKFNLPAGHYTMDFGSVTVLPMPVFFRSVTLPPPERRYPDPSNFRVIFGNNPNKCSIIWNHKTILFDNKFKTEPLPVVDFIINHEFGHAKYKTEKYADLWAANAMLRQGYNPSQIGSSPLYSLSNAQYERKELMIKKLIDAR